MKKMNKIQDIIVFIFALIILTADLYACDGGGGGKMPDGFIMRATVIAVREKIEVEVTEAEYADGIYEIIISDKTEITDADGKSYNRTIITEGRELLITYNGQTMLSLPPQVVAKKISVL